MGVETVAPSMHGRTDPSTTFLNHYSIYCSTSYYHVAEDQKIACERRTRMARIVKTVLASLATITASAFIYQSSSGVFHDKAPLDTHFITTKLRSQSSTSSTMPSPWFSTRSKGALDADLLVNGIPRMAKDSNFANAVIEAWNKDEQDMAVGGERAQTGSETRLFEYRDSNDGATLYGHLIRRIEPGSSTTKVPGILLFHTGAGESRCCEGYLYIVFLPNPRVSTYG